MIEAAVDALRAGELAIVPTDTVYGLAATPYSEEPVRRLYRAKGRDDVQPTALVAASLETLFESVPELDERARTIVRALLPGPYTLVLPNPARRFPWLNGTSPSTIGVRVPDLGGAGRAVLDGARAFAATSANLPGGPDPWTLADVPDELRAAAAAVVDGGTLPGLPSTVLAFTDDEPRVIREGAASAKDALDRVAAALSIRHSE